MKPRKPIPTFMQQHINSQRDAAHTLSKDTSQAAKEVFSTASIEELKDMIAANLQVLSPPEGVAKLEIEAEILKQLALLANVTLTRMLYERYKNV